MRVWRSTSLFDSFCVSLPVRFSLCRGSWSLVLCLTWTETKLTHSHSQKINCNFSVSLYPQREMEIPHRNNTKNPFIELYESFLIMSKKANVETAKSWTSLFFKVCRHIPLNNCLMVWSRVWEAKKMKKIGQVYCVSKK